MSIKNKINKSLPINQRLGQVGVNTKNEEMIISEYNNSKNIMVTFLHNGINVKSTYSLFNIGKIKNPLHYKEKYEGQIRKATNGQWMKLLIWNNSQHCVVEFEDETLVDCEYNNFIKTEIANPNYVKPSENQFYYNDKLNCWVGVTKKGEEFLFSHPDERIVTEIKSCTWYVNHNTYVHNTKTDKRLHHVIKPITDNLKEQGYDRIDHINNDPLDNRYENLRYSNAKENAKNKKSIGKSGITGLRYQKSNSKWFGCCNRLNTKYYKDRNEALIDLLIMQRLLNYTHNEHLFYMLDDIPQERIDYVENYIKEKIEKQKNNEYKINCCNTFERIDDDTYKMYDSKGRSCLVDAEDVGRIKLGNWHCDVNNCKTYFSGNYYFENNILKRTRLHRYIKKLTDSKYSKFIVDHLDGNELNNKRDNLIITNSQGNSINITGKGVYLTEQFKFASQIKYRDIINKFFIFNNKEDAIKFYLNCKKYLINGRLQWETKEKLDKWIEDVEDNGLTIDKVMEQHYTKLYMSLKDLIEEFDRDRSSSFLMQ